MNPIYREENRGSGRSIAELGFKFLVGKPKLPLPAG